MATTSTFVAEGFAGGRAFTRRPGVQNLRALP